MKKNELIEKLQAIEGNPNVALFDLKTEIELGLGVISDFSVELVELEDEESKELYKEEHDEDFKPWISISFNSEFIDDL